jgi:tetratricopeptide (TPR) repeat protein
MRFLLAKQQAPEVIAKFANEDLSKWPFWKRGDGFHARGRAYSITKAGDKAEADLKAALEFTSEPRTRDAILLLQGQNRENNLKNDDTALEAYNAIIADRKQIGGADEFGALQGIARILTRKGRFDEALAVLDRANPDKLQGVWKTNIMKSIEAVKQARK